jgi:drug/metabolite transporter (DMT)-like permease
VSGPALLLVAANVVYGTSAVATRIALDDAPPATLALFRLVLSGLVLAPLAWAGGAAGRLTRAEHARVLGMGLLGFAAAYGLSHWGLERSTATNAALLIVVEPMTLMALGPLLLGERLAARDAAAGALALAGAVLVVADGVPGATAVVAPHWRGDLLLVLSGVAFAAYSLLGRGVLVRHRALPVTALSIAWGAVAMAPLAVLEWADGRRPAWTGAGLAALVYLAVVVTAVGYLVWNHALARTETPRVAVFLTVQPVVGAVLGVLLLREPVSVFTVAGGVLVVAGLWATSRPG